MIESRDQAAVGAEIKAILQRRSDWRVALVDGPRAQKACTHADLVIPVLPAGTETGEQLLATLRAGTSETPLLPVVALIDTNELVGDLLLQTSDFLVAPLRPMEVLARVSRLLPWSRERERAGVEGSVAETVALAQLIGDDPAFAAVKRKLPLVAQCEAPVLLNGETGTGKELCARAIHYLSRRASKPFLPVNCGAFPSELFESALFGHEKGAFTGAWAAQSGLIAEAEHGTLFLDEIDSLNVGTQVKLLRFLQDHTYYALGSPLQRQADVRILAATNADLNARLRDGTFREDLFYRLAVLTVAVPPLRNRPADIPLLTDHLWTLHARNQGRQRARLSPRTMEAFCHYHWPGNIRELENVVQQIAVLTDGELIEPEDLPLSLVSAPAASDGASFRQAKSRVIEQFEKDYLMQLLRIHRGNVTQAARAAKKERRAFGRLIKKHQLVAR